MENCNNEMERVLSADELVVFGTGYVAECFWYGLERLGITSKVSFFVVSDEAVREKQFHGKPVYAFRAVVLPPDSLLCLAVHSALAKDLLCSVERIVEGRAVWIYPFLHDMIYGKPVETGVPIRGRDLLKRQDISCNWISVRYLTAKAFLHRSGEYDQVCDIYIKAMSAHCRPETAAERLHDLEALAESMSSGGYDEKYPILIDSRWRIIDGLHRVAVASVLDIDSIPCNIVTASDAFDVLLSDENKLPDNMLIRAGLSEEQRKMLAKAKLQLIEDSLRY